MRGSVELAAATVVTLGLALAFPLGAAEAVAVNPLLQTPIDQLRPDEVRFMQQRLADWPQLQRYRDANARLPAAVPGQPRVVFFGDSITEGWGREGNAGFFPGKGWLNRSICAVVLASVLPVSEYPWMPGITPAPKVRALNTALKRYAEAKQLVYLDYYTPMANAAGGLDPQLAEDGVHPTAKGYAVMAPLAEAAVKRALQQK